MSAGQLIGHASATCSISDKRQTDGKSQKKSVIHINDRDSVDSLSPPLCTSAPEQPVTKRVRFATGSLGRLSSMMAAVAPRLMQPNVNIWYAFSQLT